MPTFEEQIQEHQNAVTEDDQKKAGQPIAGSMDDRHTDFLKELVSLIESGDIVLSEPQSFFNQDVYEKLDEEWHEKADIALSSIVTQVKLIYDFYQSDETPDSSPQLQTMVEQLRQMKQEIEEHHDVFKF